MKKYSKTWCKCNNLLSCLRSCKVVEQVDKYYAGFGNPAPAAMLQYTMDALQHELDSAKKKGK